MNDSNRFVISPNPKPLNRSNRRPDLEQGFTLLELLVVLAIIGIVIGAAIFITAPSTAQKGTKVGSDTWDLMRSARTLSMMHRKIYGLELQQGGESDNEASLSLVVWQSEESAALLGDSPSSDSIDGNDPIPIYEEDLADSDPDDSESDSLDSEEEEDKPDYTEHKDKAIDLGLIEWEESMEWVLKDEKSVIVLPEDIRLDFTQEVSFSDESSGFGSSLDDNPASATDDLDDLEEINVNAYSPIVLFFPDGKISNAGRFNFRTDGGEVVFRFSWNELGEFERIN